MTTPHARPTMDMTHVNTLHRAAGAAHVPVNTAVKVFRGDWINATDTSGRSIADQLTRALETQGVDPSHFRYLVSTYDIPEA